MPKAGLKLKQNYIDCNEFLRGKKILITGGTGYFGNVLAELILFLNEKYLLDIELHILSRGEHPHWPGAKYHRHDVGSPFHTNPRLPEHIDYIIHAASPLNVITQLERTLAERIIVNGTRHALAYAKSSKCSHFLLISSGAVYGLPTLFSAPLTEDFCDFVDLPTTQCDIYGELKREAEKIVMIQANQSAFPKLTVARCFSFCGRYFPIDRHFALSSLMANALAGVDLMIRGNGLDVRSYMDSEDLAFWLIHILAEAPHGAHYNVGSQEAITIEELARKILKLSPRSEIVIQTPKKQGDVGSYYIPNTAKAHTELNLNCYTTIEESLENMYLYHSSLGHLKEIV